MRQAIETAEAVKKARQQWEGAPFHVKAMAGAYVEPILAALEAQQRFNLELLRLMERKQ